MCLIAPFLVGEGSVSCVSEGPKVEEMGGIGEPQSDFLL